MHTPDGEQVAYGPLTAEGAWQAALDRQQDAERRQSRAAFLGDATLHSAARDDYEQALADKTIAARHIPEIQEEVDRVLANLDTEGNPAAGLFNALRGTREQFGSVKVTLRAQETEAIDRLDPVDKTLYLLLPNIESTMLLREKFPEQADEYEQPLYKPLGVDVRTFINAVSIAANATGQPFKANFSNIEGTHPNSEVLTIYPSVDPENIIEQWATGRAPEAPAAE